MDEKNIFILTGPVKTGKTTRLIEWAEKKGNATGIATPVIEENRMFYDLHRNELFPMEASTEDKNILQIGKYRFNKDSFMKAESIIEEGIVNNNGFVIIDEIGPLELRGEGFNKIFKKIMNIEKRNFDLVVVIRDSCLNDVLEYFEIKKYQIWMNS